MQTIGIDLGTTNSVVYTVDKGRPRVVSIYGRNTTPSVVGWNPDTGKIVIGHKAKNRIMFSPETMVVSNKRNMGKQDFYYEILGNKYTPVDIASFLLRYIVDGASESLGEPIKKVVITVPAYFQNPEREATRKAAEQANLEVLLLQAEPTAAAIAYGFEQEKNQTILVYDLGGGTFDISILEIKDNSFKTLALGGDLRLGGDDFDKSIMDYFYKDILTNHGLDLKNDQTTNGRKARQKLKKVAEEAKIELSNTLQADVVLASLYDTFNFECTITRAKYRDLIWPHLSKTIDLLRTTLKDSGLDSDDINRVICVGGSTKSPLVSEILEKEVKLPFMAKNVDEIVAHGAAIAAANFMAPTKDLTQVNLTTLDLGIRVENDDFVILIPRNTAYPCTFEKEFSTAYDNASETEIEVFQGNNVKCNSNIPVGGVLLKGIQKAAAGIPRIDVKFNMDEDGILNITASDRSTKVEKNLIIEHFQPVPYIVEKDSKRTLQDLNIAVSPIGYDDVGAILTEIGISWQEIDDDDFSKYKKLKRYDVLFINCLSGGDPVANGPALNKFVKKGGILYASDCAQCHINEAFPGELNIVGNNHFFSNVKCRINNQEFRNALGKEKMNITFNSVLYYPESSNNPKSEVILSGQTKGSGQKPVTLNFPYGEGYVVYTAFHNYGSATKEEQELLKFLILKPISVALKTPLVELSDQLI